MALFSGFSSSSSVPAGSLANASSVGANTVNGPAPLSVSTSPAACSAFASVVNEPAPTAVSTMSFSPSARATPAVATSPSTATVATIDFIAFFIVQLLAALRRLVLRSDGGVPIRSRAHCINLALVI